MKLIEILDSDNIDLVLVDTSTQDDGYLGRDTYETTKYSCLDVELLAKEIEIVRQNGRSSRKPKNKDYQRSNKRI